MFFRSGTWITGVLFVHFLTKSMGFRHFSKLFRNLSNFSKLFETSWGFRPFQEFPTIPVLSGRSRVALTISALFRTLSDRSDHSCLFSLFSTLSDRSDHSHGLSFGSERRLCTSAPLHLLCTSAPLHLVLREGSAFLHLCTWF